MGSRVYACTSCKRLCRDGNTAENKPLYRQCDPAELDLFDGVDDEDEFTSIGIGDKQPSVYANLSCNDRMALLHIFCIHIQVSSYTCLSIICEDLTSHDFLVQLVVLDERFDLLGREQAYFRVCLDEGCNAAVG